MNQRAQELQLALDKEVWRNAAEPSDVPPNPLFRSGVSVRLWADRACCVGMTRKPSDFVSWLGRVSWRGSAAAEVTS